MPFSNEFRHALRQICDAGKDQDLPVAEVKTLAVGHAFFEHTHPGTESRRVLLIVRATHTHSTHSV